VPLNDRVANKNTTLPRGGGPDGLSPIFVPKGGIMVYHAFTMHRDPELWGDDAEEFRPERWNKLKAGYNMTAFGAGPRICPGRKFFLPFSLEMYFT